MNLKTTYALFGLLIGVLILFVVALWRADQAPEGASDYVFPALHRPAEENKGAFDEKVKQVEIKRTEPQETIIFQRDPSNPKGWVIAEPRHLRADTFAVNDLIRQVYDARTTMIDRPADKKSVGLDPPREEITLTLDSGQTVKLDVGEATRGEETGVVYVSSSERPEVLGVRKRDLETAMKQLGDFRSKELITAPVSDISDLKLALGKGDKKDVVELKKVSADRWKFVQPPYGDAAYQGSMGFSAAGKPPAGVSSLLNDITGLRVHYQGPKDSDFVADDVKDLSKYHLGKDDEVLRIEIAKEEGEKEKKTTHVALLVGVGKKVGDKNDKYYAVREGERDVVRVPAQGIDPILKLAKNPESLRDKNLVEFTGFKKPDALNIHNSYGQIELRRPDPAKPWQLYRGGSDKGQPASEQEVNTLITRLTQKDLVKSFPDPKRKTELGLNQPADKLPAVVSIWTDAFDAEAKKKEGKPKLKDEKKPAVQLRFGNREAGNVAVERLREGESEGTLLMVPQDVLDLVQRGPLAYLDKSLPQFAPGSIDAAEHVTKLVLDRDGTTYEVVREKEGKAWKLVQPKSLAGREADPRAVEDIMNALNRLHAKKLVAEKPSTEAVEKEYGLKSPRLRAVVTVTKDGKPKTHEYLFGKEEGTDAVFARQGERDLVFTVDKEVLATLRKDLRSPVVFQLDPTKIQQVKMTGWQNVVPTPFTWEVERKDGKWVAKAPAGVQVDAAKLDRFVNDLSKLRADQFLDRGPQDDQDLKPAKGALQVEVVVSGEKEPYRLTVGKADGDKGYFATSNRTGDSVFLVRKALFDEVKKSPNYFKK